MPFFKKHKKHYLQPKIAESVIRFLIVILHLAWLVINLKIRSKILTSIKSL